MPTQSEIDQAVALAKGAIRYCQAGGDSEILHKIADEALCDLLTGLGHKDVVDEWKKVEKWYA